MLLSLLALTALAIALLNTRNYLLYNYRWHSYKTISGEFVIELTTFFI